MRLRPTPFIGRRAIIAGLSGAGLAAVAGGACAAALYPTPRQTAGPFYPVDWSGDADNDLVRVNGEAAQALGDVLHVRGRILDASGAPMSGARVEIWQCDAKGVYRHPGDNRGSRRSDAAFQGRGRTLADAGGAFSFRTIRPVPYPGRTPHIHYRVEAGDGRSLFTQMYVADDPVLPGDFVLAALSERDRQSVTVPLQSAVSIERGAKACVFDIVLA